MRQGFFAQAEAEGGEPLQRIGGLGSLLRERRGFVRILVAQHSWPPEMVRIMRLDDFIEALIATDEYNRAMQAAMDKGD